MHVWGTQWYTFIHTVGTDQIQPLLPLLFLTSSTHDSTPRPVFPASPYKSQHVLGIWLISFHVPSPAAEGRAVSSLPEQQSTLCLCHICQLMETRLIPCLTYTKRTQKQAPQVQSERNITTEWKLPFLLAWSWVYDAQTCKETNGYYFRSLDLEADCHSIMDNEHN